LCAPAPGSPEEMGAFSARVAHDTHPLPVLAALVLM
jgi:hypothetical protein